MGKGSEYIRRYIKENAETILQKFVFDTVQNQSGQTVGSLINNNTSAILPDGSTVDIVISGSPQLFDNVIKLNSNSPNPNNKGTYYVPNELPQTIQAGKSGKGLILGLVGETGFPTQWITQPRFIIWDSSSLSQYNFADDLGVYDAGMGTVSYAGSISPDGTCVALYGTKFTFIETITPNPIFDVNQIVKKYTFQGFWTVLKGLQFNSSDLTVSFSSQQNGTFSYDTSSLPIDITFPAPTPDSSWGCPPGATTVFNSWLVDVETSILYISPVFSWDLNNNAILDILGNWTTTSSATAIFTGMDGGNPYGPSIVGLFNDSFGNCNFASLGTSTNHGGLFISEDIVTSGFSPTVLNNFETYNVSNNLIAGLNNILLSPPPSFDTFINIQPVGSSPITSSFANKTNGDGAAVGENSSFDYIYLSPYSTIQTTYPDTDTYATNVCTFDSTTVYPALDLWVSDLGAASPAPPGEYISGLRVIGIGKFIALRLYGSPTSSQASFISYSFNSDTSTLTKGKNINSVSKLNINLPNIVLDWCMK